MNSLGICLYGCKSLMRSMAMWLVFSLYTVSISAGGIDPVIAEKVARSFYISISAIANEAIRKEGSGTIELKLVHREYVNPAQEEPDIRKSLAHPLYYVFNVSDNKGFVIVSGNDRVKPVLGYALTGAFRKSQQSPAFQAWMESYKKQIIYALEHGSDMNRAFFEEWIQWKEDSPEMEGKTEGQHSSCMVLPLVSTKWNQGCVYNACCPADTSGPCGRAYAGCTAVAMAQVLNYWKHPDTCRRLEGYYDQENLDFDWQVIPNSDYGWIEADLPHAYDWSVMPDELNDRSAPREIGEVSRLLFHCGVSLKMNYGPEGSQADGAAIPPALTDCFGYSPSMQYLRRQNFSPDAWKNLLKVELDAGRPVLYIGTGNKGGHAFLCDGYDRYGYFHFNWGWGGANDEYFCLDALVPGSTSLTDAQRAIIGIRPEFPVKDPCENIIPIKGEGILHAQRFHGGDQGSWNNYLCGWSTPGREQIYSVVAPSTGLFSLVVTSIEDYMDCGWKANECGPGGWNCIGDICSTGIYGPMSWKEGEIYYILFDDEDTTASRLEFYIESQVSTGSEYNSKLYQMSVFLHPDSRVLTIEASQPGAYTADLISVNGTVLFSERKMVVPGQLDVSFLPEGVYLLTLRREEFVTTSKFVLF